jgi:hypothetical protein
MDAEREFLRAQAAQARAALRTNTRGLAEDLLAPLRLRAAVRRHAWLGLGAATGLGALLGSWFLRRTRTPAAGHRARRRDPAAGSVLQRAMRFSARAMQAVFFASLRTPAGRAAPPEPDSSASPPA